MNPITRRSFCIALPSLLSLPLQGCGDGGNDAPTSNPSAAGAPSSCAFAPAQGARIDLSSFYQRAAQPQQAMLWCWAASIAMVFAAKGFPISQARIVSTAYGSVVNMSAYGITIAQALDRAWTDDAGRPFRSVLTGVYDYQAGVSSLSNAGIVSSIRAGTPVIVGTGSHARVLIGVDYQSTPTGPNIVGGVVFDPFYAQVQCLSYPELFVVPAGGAIMFMATVNVA